MKRIIILQSSQRYSYKFGNECKKCEFDYINWGFKSIFGIKPLINKNEKKNVRFLVCMFLLMFALGTVQYLSGGWDRCKFITDVKKS